VRSTHKLCQKRKEKGRRKKGEGKREKGKGRREKGIYSRVISGFPAEIASMMPRPTAMTSPMISQPAEM
jgi:hypothetical protein